MKKITFIVNEINSGQRLDLFLTLEQSKFSRSSIKVHINEGKVIVNNKIEYRPNYKVRIGDNIVLIQKDTEKILKIKPQNLYINIIYEDHHLLVVNKPSGMVVHPADGNTSNTLMNLVLYHFQKIKNVGDGIRSGLIHRLDKDTSGLVLIGKTNKALWYYSNQFAERKVKKTYIAIVKGDIKNYTFKKEFEINSFIKRNPIKRKKFSVSKNSEGKYAMTKIKFLKNCIIDQKICSVILAFPKTGRTHQLRVHLSSIGYPIIGDKIYGRKNFYSRLLLHAWKIEVTLINGKNIQFVAKLPDEFNF